MKITQIDNKLLRYKLDKPVGGSGVASVDVLISRVRLASGAEGLGFSYVLAGHGAPAFAALLALSRTAEDRTLLHPEDFCRRLQSTLNRTRRGPNYIALAALDLALWDAFAVSRGVPLGVALGGAPRAVPVYGSGGFNPKQSPEEAGASAAAHAARGLRAVKPRVSGALSDERLLRAVRDAAPGTELMLDANEKCTATTAARLLGMARELGALFFEEPLPADDVAGYRVLARAYPGLLATGEHLQGVAESLPFIAERLCGVFQPDLAAMGGLTECLRVTRLAEAFGIEVSPHFLPGLFVHLAAAAPNVTWLEEFPLLEPLFAGWPELLNGSMTAADRPGHGLALAEGAMEKYKAT
jgi:L-alanine-DL-glutamate epimerase-like enolase superfamily enzyme